MVTTETVRGQEASTLVVWLDEDAHKGQVGILVDHSGRASAAPAVWLDTVQTQELIDALQRMRMAKQHPRNEAPP